MFTPVKQKATWSLPGPHNWVQHVAAHMPKDLEIAASKPGLVGRGREEIGVLQMFPNKCMNMVSRRGRWQTWVLQHSHSDAHWLEQQQQGQPYPPLSICACVWASTITASVRSHLCSNEWTFVSLTKSYWPNATLCQSHKNNSHLTLGPVTWWLQSLHPRCLSG